MAQTFPRQPLSKEANTTMYPIYPTKGGKITNDVETPEVFCQLMCGVAGSVIVQNTEGENRYYPQFSAGVLYPAAGVKVVASATVDGEEVTTTAENIWWFGGQ